MEKEGSWDLKWQSTAKLPPELNSASATDHELPQCFFNLNWEQPMTHDADFESALSSLVSSPSSNPPASADGAVVGELGCRLGSICNSGQISPSSRHRSANTYCHSTPLNSPPKLNLSVTDHRQQGRGGLPMPVNAMPRAHIEQFSAGPGFMGAPARLSCFGGRSTGRFTGQFVLPETRDLSRVSSSQSLKAGIGFHMKVPENGYKVGILGPAQQEIEMRSKFGGSSTPEESELGDRVTAEVSSLRGITDSNTGQRKAAAKRKGKEAPLSCSSTNPPANITEEEESDAKRCKAAVKTKMEQNRDPGQKQGKDNDAKPLEPPKDYIHVRARRGQATDPHSLAERFRREKISKRMKYLQDLVPGCNKVTGKAVMLDEIINYVQSLQRQVEFLSMKLATLNPQLDLNMENLLSKDLYQACGPMLQPDYAAETMSTVLSYAHQPQTATLLEAQFSNPLESSLCQSQSMQLAPIDGYTDATTQLGDFWEDDLQSVAQIGYGQNLQGQMHTCHMKIEL